MYKVLDGKHLAKKHPGEIQNRPLLKRFNKYVRAPRSDHPDNLVCSQKIKEDTDYILVTKRLWNFLEKTFGADHMIKRHVSTRTYFRTKYRILHEHHLKILILPPVNQISSLE